jgi:hypothetical protein
MKCFFVLAKKDVEDEFVFREPVIWIDQREDTFHSPKRSVSGSQLPERLLAHRFESETNVDQQRWR